MFLEDGICGLFLREIELGAVLDRHRYQREEGYFEAEKRGSLHRSMPERILSNHVRDEQTYWEYSEPKDNERSEEVRLLAWNIDLCTILHQGVGR